MSGSERVKLGMFRCAAASVMFVISLGGEIAAAAEPGFYVGAAGARSEQRLDEQAGAARGPVAILVPPSDSFNPGPVPRPPIQLPPGFVGGLPIAAIVLLGPEVSADEVDIGWNFALGYRVNKYFAAELAYVDAGEASLRERYRSPP